MRSALAVDDAGSGNRSQAAAENPGPSFGASGSHGGGVEVCGVGCEHGLPCVGEGFGCRDEFDDAVGVVGVHGLPSRCGGATSIDLLYNLQGDLRNVFASVGIDFSLESGWKAADREPIRASVATLAFPTKTPLNWGCARWSEGSLFGHWRSGVAFAQVSCRSTRRGGQGAPSTIRCIKTSAASSVLVASQRVREHPAPSGALRLEESTTPRDASRSGSTQHHQVH